MNGCFNRAPLKTMVVVQNGHFMDEVTRVPRMVSIPNPMTTSCQYTLSPLGAADSACAGCSHQSKAVAAQKVT